MPKLRIFISAVILVMAAALMACAGTADPGIVPTPKQYKAVSGTLAIGGLTIYTRTDNKQCKIAAQELQLHIRELGGTPGTTAEAVSFNKPGIYVLPASDALAAGIAKTLKIKVSANYPGRQGYVLHTAKDRVVIIGSDNVGTLYGAMTLRQMMRKSGSKVAIQSASITDWPDYRCRSAVNFWRGLDYLAIGEKDRPAAVKAGIDWMMRFKLNVLWDCYDYVDTRQFPAAEKDRIRQANEYAWDRGIYPTRFRHEYIGRAAVDNGDKRFDGWDCIYLPKSESDGTYYCWSRDDLTAEAAKREADFCKEEGFKMVFLHPVDGGGISDPELWSKRCDLCREKYGNNRSKASADQYNKWTSALKASVPDVLLSAPIYPYIAEYSDYNIVKGTLSEPVWKKNSVDYWAYVQKETDKDLMPMVWEADRKDIDRYRGIFKDRAVVLFAHSFNPSGYFGTWHRFARTDYRNPDDVYLLTGGCTMRDKWMECICDGEFSWNINAPGAEDYQGLMYDIEKDYSEPKVIIDSWVPRTCKAFYGEEVGSRIAPVYQLGIQPDYIIDPGQAIATANRWRRGIAEFSLSRKMAEDVVDSSARMKAQVDATAKALAAMQSALPYLNTMDKYQRKSFMYFYKRMPLWHMIANARYASYYATELQRDGKMDEARAVLRQGLTNLEQDNQAAGAILKATQNENDETYYGPAGENGDTNKPSYAELKTLLQNLLAGVGMDIKPRQVGQIARVGLYKGFGAEGTKLYLNGFSNVQAEIINSLALPVLDKYDCVFVFQTPSIPREEYFGNLAQYVRSGGRGVLLQHDLCGFSRSQFGATTPFTDVCASAFDRRDAVKLFVKQAHPTLPGLAAGQSMDHMYFDHEVLKAGKDGTTVAVDEKGDPVVVVGKVGAGKVIFDGNVSLITGNKESQLTGFNAVLAKGAVEWFTGLTLKEK